MLSIHVADRRARSAIAAMFLVNGAIIGSWAAHIPLAKERLGVGNAALGLALLGMAAGALVAMPLAGLATSRFGSAVVVRVSTIAFCLALPAPVLAPSLLTLTVALIIFGAANGVMDVAMNAHGVVVERRLGQPVMSSYHGMFSLGGLAGAGLAALILPVMPPIVHAGLLGATGLGVAAFALPQLLPASVDLRDHGPAFALPNRASIWLGALTFLALLSEGSVLDWSAVHLGGDLGLGPQYAAIGFAAFSASMAAARFTGDWMRARFGAVAIVRGSAALATAGLALALLAPVAPLAIAGFAIVGLGLANLVPIFFGAAGALPGQASGGAIAAVATMGYLGFLAGPPLIGFVAEASTLTFALGLVVLACALVGLAAKAAGVARQPARELTSEPARPAGLAIQPSPATAQIAD